MQHSVHIIWGEHSEELVTGLGRHIRKYEACNESRFCKCVLGSLDSDGNWLFKQSSLLEQADSKFVPGLDNEYEQQLLDLFTIEKTDREAYIDAFITTLYRSMVTIDNPGNNSLHITFDIPAYNKDLWAMTAEMLRVINKVKLNIEVDLLLFTEDLVHIFEKKIDVCEKKARVEAQKAVIKEIIDFKSDCYCLKNLLLIQNINAERQSLNFDKDTIVKTLGEYLLLSVQFRGTYLVFLRNANPDKPLTAFGISALDLDKYAFAQYLLHRCYLHILEREKATGSDKVDVNKVSKIAQDILAKNVSIFSNIYNKEVRDLLDRKISHDDIIVEMTPLIQAKINELAAEYSDFINDKQLSLPEKQAALAQLLGEDDELLSGYLYNVDQYTIDDCEREVVNLFIEANNLLLSTPEEDELRQYAVLSRGTDGEAKDPSKELRAISVKIKDSTQYIRFKKNELKDIESIDQQREESVKRLTEEGFIYEGKLYKLLTEEPEIPLEETYVPVSSVLPKAIDLRNHCTPIKDQGQVGACAAFAMTAIYEYILKKNKQEEQDLSERFLYYNVRKKKNEENSDTGSNFYDLIQSLSEEGICKESLFEYSGTDYKTAPSEEAYADALSRKVKKGKNVKVNVDDIRSAISEGYPVAISLNLYNSFGSTGAFIKCPDEGEIHHSTHGRHAMVICGYSDNEKFFIVRNSWGKSFGDMGYCYIPYSYIGNPALLNMACIITEISQHISVAGIDEHLTVSFDMANSQIRAAVLENLINEESIKLASYHQVYKILRKSYEELLQSIENHSNRSALAYGTRERLANEIRKSEIKYSILQTERLTKLDELKTLRNKFIVAGIINTIVLIGIIVSFFYIGDSDILKNLLLAMMFIFIICELMIGIWLLNWKRKYNRLDRDLKEEINELNARIESLKVQRDQTKLKFHLAGITIDNMTTLQKTLKEKYYAMRSYVGNLGVWYKEEMAKEDDQDIVQSLPFISLLTKSAMSKFFETEKERITKDIQLSDLFNTSYKNTESEIEGFKCGFKNKLYEELKKALNDFSMFNYILGLKKYPYLKEIDLDKDQYFKQLDAKSTIFVNENCPELETEVSTLYVNAKSDEELRALENKHSDQFKNRSSFKSSCGKFKLILLKYSPLDIDNIHGL